MSVDTTLDASLTLILAKARSGLGTTTGGGTSGGGTPAPAAVARTTTINFQWSSGGASLVPSIADPIVIEIPYACRVSWAHMRAGDAAGNPTAVTAAADLQLSQFETFGGKTPMSGSGSAPSLTSASKSNVSLSGWKTDLSIGDTITARLTAFSGTATWVSLILLLQSTDVPVTISLVADSSGNQLIDSAGNPIVIRG